MTTRKFIIVLILSIITISIFRCKAPEIILHGGISGIVTDAISNQPVQAASVKLSNTNDTTSTGSDGTFLLRNVEPNRYEIQSSKLGYGVSKKNVTVTSAETNEIDFTLSGIPVPVYSSTCIDFGLDSTIRSFTISNLGKGTFSYFITKSQNWITVSPSSGEITNESDKIRVSINKTGLSDNIYNGIIEVTSTGPGVLIKDTLHVNLNGVADRDCNYYKVVKIGTQTWMAENLNLGIVIDIHQLQANNGYIEKWCYNCKIYGGLYNWNEAMNYSPSDTGNIGKTQGICPVGWHIPTDKEVITLSDYLAGPGEEQITGGMLKATGTSLWQYPNLGATNVSGFTALPGGAVYLGRSSTGSFNSNENPDYNYLDGIGTSANFWTSKFFPQLNLNPSDPQPRDSGGTFGVDLSTTLYILGTGPVIMGNSVRCVKNP